MQLKTDRELLESYATDRNDAACAELVARYSPMVYRACLRVLGNASDAEEATQAAFLVLARKAGSLRQEGRLNGWLHRVARQVALQALRVRADRERRQEQVAVTQERMTMDEPEADTEAVFKTVDAELDGLSAILREAVVLRYLRGLSEQEAAAQAGCPVGTMKWRASEALAKLRQRLAKRGVALSGVGLAGLLTSEASAAVPETLLPSILATVKTAVATTATATGATTTAGLLAKGAMKAMFIAKVKMVALVTAAAIAVGGAGVTVAVAVAKESAKTVHHELAEPPAPTTDRAGLATSLNDNAALDYWQAILAMKELPESLRKVIGEKKVEAVDEAFLKSTAPVMAHLRRGAAKSACAWGIEYAEYGPDTLLPHLQARAIFRLVSLRYSYRVAQGQGALAVAELADAWGFARRFGEDQCLISVLLQFAGETQCADSAASCLPALDESSLRILADRLDRLPVTLDWKKLMRREMEVKDGYSQTFRATASDEATARLLTGMFDGMDPANSTFAGGEKALGHLKRDEILRLLEELTPLYAEMADLLERPLPEFEKKQKVLKAKLQEKAKTNPFVDAFTPSFLMKYTAAAAQAKQAMLRAAIAFRLGGPKEMEKVPDPYGEGPFAFEPLPGNGFLLRSKLHKNGDPVTLTVGKSSKDSPAAGPSQP